MGRWNRIVDPRDYIQSKVVVDESGCWLWQGALTQNGYGRAKLNDHADYAHRFSYSVYRGPIPKGKFVLHHCDVPSCVNPDHLYAGSHQDNMDDRTRRDRACTGDDHWTRQNPEKVPRGADHPANTMPERWARGDEHWTRKHPERVLRGDKHPLKKNKGRARRGSGVNMAKLDDEKVREIRALYAKGRTQVQLAEQFDVFQTTISQIVRRKTWTHVE